MKKFLYIPRKKKIIRLRLKKPDHSARSKISCTYPVKKETPLKNPQFPKRKLFLARFKE